MKYLYDVDWRSVLIGAKHAELLVWHDYPYITALVVPGFLTTPARNELQAALAGELEHLTTAVDQYWSTHMAQVHAWAERKKP